MLRFLSCLLALLTCTLLLAQDDQRPRPPVKNERGLLQVNRTYYDSTSRSNPESNI